MRYWGLRRRRECEGDGPAAKEAQRLFDIRVRTIRVHRDIGKASGLLLRLGLILGVVL